MTDVIKKKANDTIKMANLINLENRAQIERIIAGALKCAIDSHGPITVELRSSAAKRVFSALKQFSKQRKSYENLHPQSK